MEKVFYRVANNDSQQGLWYYFSGKFTGLIHNEMNFCKNKSLPMPFDKNIVGWLSATDSLEELFNWFPYKDILKLEKYGFSICLYKASEYKFYNNHWIIKQDSSVLVDRMSLAFAI